MKCPFCSSPDSRVIDSRPADEDQSIRRRRECTVCRQRFTTFEVVERLPLVVIKKDGSRQAYDRNKLLNGLLKACEKRPVPLRSLENIADEIELQLENRLEREIPSRVIGELARLFNAGIGADLAVIPMRGWERGMVFNDTRLPWVPTSPGMPTTATAMVYPGTCLLEGTSISEGRGTTLPFELVGAPWLDGYALAAELNALNLPGVRFRPAAFTPISSKFAGTTCGGVQVHVLDPGSFQPLLAGISLLSACLCQQPEHVTFLPDSWEGTHPHFDLLAGSSDLRRDLLAGTAPEEIATGWHPYETAFRSLREPYLLY